MKVCFVVMLILVSAGGLCPAEGQVLTVGLYGDVSAVDTLWTDHLYLHGGMTIGTGRPVSLEIPVTYVIQDDGHAVFDTGLLIKYYPFDRRFWIGATLFQGVTLQGEDRPDEWYIYMQEYSSGMTIPITESLYLEPSLALRDLNGIFHDSLSMVSEYAAGYSRLRFCLKLGWRGIEVPL